MITTKVRSAESISIKRTDLDLADFTSQLVLETSQAIIKSLLDQEKEIKEIEKIIALEPAGVSELMVSEQELRQEILRLFPSNDGDKEKSAVDPGSVYIAQSKEREEYPQISKLTNYRLLNIDLNGDKDNGEAKITEQGYTNIKEDIRLSLAETYKDNIASVLQRGIPRIVVDNGKINTKVSFFLQENEKNTRTDQTNTTTDNSVLPRIMVRPVSTNSPEFLNLKVNVVGEMEIAYKTIV